MLLTKAFSGHHCLDEKTHLRHNGVSTRAVKCDGPGVHCYDDRKFERWTGREHWWPVITCRIYEPLAPKLFPDGWHQL